MEKKVNCAIKENGKVLSTSVKIDDETVITCPSVGDIAILYGNPNKRNTIKNCHDIIVNLDDNKINILYGSYNDEYPLVVDNKELGLYHFVMD